jgi:hypothetical protein
MISSRIAIELTPLNEELGGMNADARCSRFRPVEVLIVMGFEAKTCG